METRPLLLYYGAAAYAKALVIAFTGCQPGNLAQSHGLQCSAKNGEKIADFCIKAKGDGLFQQFNNVVASQNRIRFFEGTSARSKIVPSSSSDRLANLEVSLSDCFAHIPDLQSVYELCTGRPSNVQHLHFDSDFQSKGGYGIRVDIPELFDNIESLQSLVSAVRDKVPFLKHWRLKEAVKAWDNSVFQFENIEPALDEFGFLAGDANHYRASTPGEVFDPFERLAPLAGGLGASSAYIESISGEQISEFSLMLASLLGLSNLVRYSPHIWTSCIYRQPIAGRPVDDELLPVIEKFLGNVTDRFPILVTNLLLS